MFRHTIRVIVLMAFVFLTGLNTIPRVLAQSSAQDVTFPDLTGQYPVGRTSFEWVDQSRNDTFASVPGLKRDLMVYVWFPAQPNRRAPLTTYMDGGSTWDALMSKAFGAYQGLESKVHIHALRTTAVSSDKPTYPVLIFVPGFGMTSFNYSSIIEELASHGYIVIGTSHPFSSGIVSYPDGRFVQPPTAGPSTQLNQDLLEVWKKDVEFVLTQAQQLNTSDANFKGHLDLTNIGILGQGFGGVTATEVISLHQEIKAGANLDGPLTVKGAYATNTMSQPFLFAGTNAVPKPEQKVPEKFLLNVQGTTAANYSDFALLKPLISQQMMYGNVDLSLGTINSTRAVQIIDAELLAFFDHYLKGSDLKWPSFNEASLVAF